MLFNSLEFAVFFIIVYSLYRVLNHTLQNRMLLVASYIFYGAWDWRFLTLIFISTCLDYFCGIKIHRTDQVKIRKRYLFLSVFGNLSILGFFKYFNFFAENLQILIGQFGLSVEPRYLTIILPVGISFYTFQTMSYTIDIFRNRMKPTTRFLDFALFVAFFPQLVAGPIERARNLLPQILSPRRMTTDKLYEGCYLIFWGLFQKVVVADNLAKIVDPVFSEAAPYNGLKVLLALYAFAFQIFCDFAGYSNIARGIGKCMGFEIMVNFNLPYFATNPKEFWRRWHISLSSWLKDYLYIPLGGNKGTPAATYRNLMLTMLLGGLWHGAAWIFIAWGAYQGILLILHRLIESYLDRLPSLKNKLLVKLSFLLRVIFFFHLVCIGWLLFRAQTVKQAAWMFHSLFFNLDVAPGLSFMAVEFIFFAGLLLIIQIIQYYKEDLLVVLKFPVLLRAVLYIIFFFLLETYGIWHGEEFIYFQF